MKDKLKSIYSDLRHQEILRGTLEAYKPTYDSALNLSINMDRHSQKIVRRSVIKVLKKDIKKARRAYKKEIWVRRPLWQKIIILYLKFVLPPTILFLIIFL